MFKEVINEIPPHRMLSLDVFRGITITMMIMVNNPGSWSHMYAPLRHAEWNGWTPTDWIFPFFIFIMGISIVLSFEKQLASGKSKKELVQKSISRALKLFGLGLVLNALSINLFQPDFSFWHDSVLQLRIMGVLQRLGVVYLITALLVLYLSKRWLVITAAILLAVNWIGMALIPYPVADGVWVSGLLQHGNNFAAFIDSVVLGADHVYFNTEPLAYDPEGLWSTLTSVASCLAGVFTGWYITPSKNDYKQVSTVLFTGVAVLVAGYVASIFIPINKTIWTPSYVLATTGVALLFLGFCMFLIDMKKVKTWSAPFVAFGANAIAFFMMAGVLGRLILMPMVDDMRLKSWIYSEFFAPAFGSLNGSLIYSIVLVALYFIPMYVMYRKGIFWKV